jgi:hypothetical protein
MLLPQRKNLWGKLCKMSILWCLHMCLRDNWCKILHQLQSMYPLDMQYTSLILLQHRYPQRKSHKSLNQQWSKFLQSKWYMWKFLLREHMCPQHNSYILKNQLLNKCR